MAGAVAVGMRGIPAVAAAVMMAGSSSRSTKKRCFIIDKNTCTVVCNCRSLKYMHRPYPEFPDLVLFGQISVMWICGGSLVFVIFHCNHAQLSIGAVLALWHCTWLRLGKKQGAHLEFPD